MLSQLLGGLLKVVENLLPREFCDDVRVDNGHDKDAPWDDEAR